MIERLRNGRFNLDDSRVRYIRWLRDPERRSARTQADADFVKAKTELIAIRIREKKRELIEIEEAKEIMDKAIGVTLVAMSGMDTRTHPLSGRQSFPPLLLQRRHLPLQPVDPVEKLIQRSSLHRLCHPNHCVPSPAQPRVEFVFAFCLIHCPLHFHRCRATHLRDLSVEVVWPSAHFKARRAVADEIRLEDKSESSLVSTSQPAGGTS